jgi:integrase
MSETKPRYFVEKPQKGGGILYYWQPSAGLQRAGFKTVPLGKDRGGAIQQAEAINRKVDQWRGGQLVIAKNVHGTLPWLVEHYRNDIAYQRLRASTKKVREFYLRQLLLWSAERGDPPMRTIKRSDAKALWMLWGDKGQVPTAQQMTSVARTLWNFALEELEDHDVVAKNPFHHLGFKNAPPRQVVWEPDQIAAIIDAALSAPAYLRGHGRGQPIVVGVRKSIADAVMIIHNTTLREGDVLALMESNYDGQTIICTPSKTRDKTGVTVHIPATPELKAWLDEMLAQRADEGNVIHLRRKQQDRPLIINEVTGRRYSSPNFGRTFRQIRTAADLPENLWFEDLRRTATVQLAEAGLSEAEIAAFGGWSATSVAAMMKIYRPTTITMAQQGMAKLVEYRSRMKVQGPKG